jgi:hypothetical protein
MDQFSAAMSPIWAKPGRKERKNARTARKNCRSAQLWRTTQRLVAVMMDG